MANVAFYKKKFENPLDGETLYTVRLVPYSTIDKNQAVDYAAKDSNVNPQDLAIGFSALAQAIEEFVLNGHSVTLDGLGNFRLTARTGVWDSKKNKWKSAGKTSMDDVSPSDIKGVYVRFRPCEQLKQEMTCAKFFDVTQSALGGALANYDHKALSEFKKKNPSYNGDIEYVPRKEA